MLLALCLMLVVPTLSGCVVACIAAGAYCSSVREEEKKAYQDANIERERTGLKPLTPDEWYLGVESGDPVAAQKTVDKAKAAKQDIPDPL